MTDSNYNGMFKVSPAKRKFYNAKNKELTEHGFHEKCKYDMHNSAIYDMDGNFIEEGKQIDYNSCFLVTILHLKIIDIKDFFNYHFDYTPNKEAFLDYLEFGILNHKSLDKGTRDFFQKLIDEKRKINEQLIYENKIAVKILGYGKQNISSKNQTVLNYIDNLLIEYNLKPIEVIKILNKSTSNFSPEFKNSHLQNIIAYLESLIKYKEPKQIDEPLTNWNLTKRYYFTYLENVNLHIDNINKIHEFSDNLVYELKINDVCHRAKIEIENLIISNISNLAPINFELNNLSKRYYELIEINKLLHVKNKNNYKIFLDTMQPFFVLFNWFNSVNITSEPKQSNKETKRITEDLEPTLKQLALYHVYLDTKMNNDNANSYLEGTSHTSGGKLKQHFDDYYKPMNRTGSGTDRENSFKLKLFRKVILMLKKTSNKDAILKAEKELKQFENNIA